jgi:IS5 family transposase
VTTNASVHDSKPVKDLVDEKDRGQDMLADSAYIGKGVKRVMRKFQMKDKVIKRNTRGKKISKWQETINKKNSKLRVRVEHVFGFCEQSLHGMFSRAIGFARNAAFNTFTNLIYNLNRYEQVLRLGIN